MQYGRFPVIFINQHCSAIPSSGHYESRPTIAMVVNSVLPDIDGMKTRARVIVGGHEAAMPELAMAVSAIPGPSSPVNHCGSVQIEVDSDGHTFENCASANHLALLIYRK